MRVKTRQRNDYSGRYNHEGYRDDTAYYALRNVMREKSIGRQRRQVNVIDINANEALREDERFCWEELANGIIIQAAKDWRKAKAVLCRPVRCREDLRRRKEAEEMIRETEEFFLSDWYAWLTDYPGDKLLERLRKEFE